MTVKSTVTPVTPSRAATASRTRFVISFFSGQPGTVRAMRTDTLPSAAGSIERTMPSSTMERWISGSSTGRRASMIWSRVRGIGFLLPVGRAVRAGVVTTAGNLHYGDR